MTVNKTWVCPDCGEGFGGDYLRCACGYEGSPICVSSESLFRKTQQKNDKKIHKNISSHIQSEDVDYNYFLAEQLLKKAEVEYHKSQLERDAVEGLKRQLQSGLKKISRIKHDDPYEILGVHKTDSIETIHRTYRAVVALYHPDKHSSATEESIKQKSNYLAKVNGAYAKILQHHKRQHDESKH